MQLFRFPFVKNKVFEMIISVLFLITGIYLMTRFHS